MSKFIEFISLQTDEIRSVGKSGDKFWTSTTETLLQILHHCVTAPLFWCCVGDAVTYIKSGESAQLWWFFFFFFLGIWIDSTVSGGEGEGDFYMSTYSKPSI